MAPLKGKSGEPLHKYNQDLSLRWEAWWHSTECQLSTTTVAKSPPLPWGSLPRRLRDHHSRNSEGDIWRWKDVIGHEKRLEVEGWAKGSLPHRTAKGSTVVVNPTKAASRKHWRTDQGHMRDDQPGQERRFLDTSKRSQIGGTHHFHEGRSRSIRNGVDVASQHTRYDLQQHLIS